jgi:hypothetical protein
MLVPQLRAELEVRTPADRGPGRAGEMGPAIDAADFDRVSESNSGNGNGSHVAPSVVGMSCDTGP